MIVVAALGIQTDDQARRANPVAQCVDIVRQIKAAAFLATFDQHDTSRVVDALFLQGTNRSEGTEDGITVIGAASPVKSTVANHRFPRLEPVGPAAELGLLVVMTVQKHDVIRLSRDIEKK